MGLMDSTADSGGLLGSFTNMSPWQQGLLALSQGLAKAGQPSPYKLGLGQALTGALPGMIDSVRGASSRQQVTDLLQKGDIKGATAAMMQSPDPEMQKYGLSMKMQPFQPDYQIKQALLQKLGGGVQSGQVNPQADASLPWSANNQQNMNQQGTGIDEKTRTLLALVDPNAANALANLPSNKEAAAKATEAGKHAAQMNANLDEVKTKAATALDLVKQLKQVNTQAPSGSFAPVANLISRNLKPGEEFTNPFGANINANDAANSNQLKQLSSALKLMDIKPLLQGTGQVRKAELEMIDKLENLDPSMSVSERASLLDNVEKLLTKTTQGAQYRADSANGVPTQDPMQSQRPANRPPLSSFMRQ